MSDQPRDRGPMDDALRRHFSALRESDARQAPDFSVMIAGTGRTRRPWRRVAWAVPLLVAAGLAVVVLSPRVVDRTADQAADREFEALVGEWTRTTQAARELPTDALLPLSGSEYLRSLPVIGGGLGAPRSRRPS